jgi:hypothetical protein
VWGGGWVGGWPATWAAVTTHWAAPGAAAGVVNKAAEGWSPGLGAGVEGPTGQVHSAAVSGQLPRRGGGNWQGRRRL